MNNFLYIAIKYILSRKRQSLVSVMGIVIGVAFFLAISSLMQGSQNDFIARLVDNSPHITISDDYRSADTQPVTKIYPAAVIELRNVKPESESRGIRGYRQIVEDLRKIPGVRASASLTGQSILSYAGRDVTIALNGMIPQDTLRYIEAVQIADVMGYDIVWQKRREK
jgi:lipoprotein-releasing system permease protein